MVELKARITAKLAEPEAAAAWQAATGGSPSERPPIFSFDNPSMHKVKSHLRELGLATASGAPTDSWLELPTYSGDLHRTIERVHARVCGQFQEWVNDTTTPRTMPFYCNKLIDLFLKQDSEQITHCMWGKPREAHPATLLALYEKVIALGGEKAPRPFY